MRRRCVAGSSVSWCAPTAAFSRGTARAWSWGLALVLVAFAAVGARADGRPGDFSGDGAVTLDDLPGFAQAWETARGGGEVDPRGDMDGNQVLDHLDARLLLEAILNPNPGMSTAERLAAMDAVRDEFQTVVDAPFETFRDTMQAFLQSRPEFTEVRVINNSVCGRFTDGQWLALDWTPAPDPNWSAPVAPAGVLPRPAGAGTASARAMAAPAAGGGPPAGVSPAQAVGNTAIPPPGPVPLYNAMGNAYSDLAGWLYNCFKSRGYTNEYPPFDHVATVSDLMSLSALKPMAVLYYSAHGGSAPDWASGVTTGHVSTATKVTAETEEEYAGELWLGNLIRVEAGFDKGPGDKTQVAELYAITSGFVITYWTFAQNSLVDISACYSNAADFGAACVGKGASVYAGWSNSVGDGVAADFDEFFFGRLLGMNAAEPKYDPPVRPFAWPEVYAEAQRRKLTVDASNGATLTMTGSAGSSLGPLAPVIDNAAIVERAPDQSDLILNGKFGVDPGAEKRQVFVGAGSDTLEVTSWQPEQVKCDLPVTGAKSSGDIQVVVHGVYSNVIPISEWQGTVTWTLKSYGTCQQKITVDFRIRGDVHPYREKLSEDKPTQPTDRYLQCTGKKGAGSYECKGQYALGNYKEVWSGSGSFDVGNPVNVNDWGSAWFTVDSIAKKVKFVFMGTSTYMPGGHGCTYDITEGVYHHIDHQNVWIGDEGFDGADDRGMPCMLLDLDDSYGFAAGKRTGHREGGQVGGDITIEWTDFKCTHPPTSPTHQAAAPFLRGGRLRATASSLAGLLPRLLGRLG